MTVLLTILLGYGIHLNEKSHKLLEKLNFLFVFIFIFLAFLFFLNFKAAFREIYRFYEGRRAQKPHHKHTLSFFQARARIIKKKTIKYQKT